MMLRSLILAACLWAGASAYLAATSWPVVPLDIGSGDPQTRAIYNRAVREHVLRYALAGLAPLGAALAASWLIRKRSRGGP